MNAVMTLPDLMTVEEFYQYRFPEGKVELVRGVPRVREPASGMHGWVQSNLAALLIPFVAQHGLGKVLNDGVGYELIALPRTVRNPDAAFIRADRLPAGGLGRGFVRMAPDLAVEVLSPDERASELEEKLDDYREAGTPLIWVIDPERRTVMIVSDDAPVRWLRADDMLEAGDVIPGFRCRVAELFEGLAT
ncbi:MAG: Uma2 family endonuclease [Gemmatimonadaceae bacterium]